LSSAKFALRAIVGFFTGADFAGATTGFAAGFLAAGAAAFLGAGAGLAALRTGAFALAGFAFGAGLPLLTAFAFGLAAGFDLEAPAFFAGAAFFLGAGLVALPEDFLFAFLAIVNAIQEKLLKVIKRTALFTVVFFV
jgi:hypothetical protein